MTEQRTTEKPLLWSTMADACRWWGAAHWGSEPWAQYGYTGDETSTILDIHEQLEVPKLRNWLHENTSGSIVTGIFLAEPVNQIYPIAARFRFETFDDKLLFSLRWL